MTLADLQEQQRSTQNQLAEVRKQAQTSRGRLSSLETLQHAALGQEQGAALSWLKARGLDSAQRVGEALSVEAGWENAVESALGQLIEGVLVEAPEALVDLDRMPDVDRAILRLGAWEILFNDEVPDGVAVSEAVALATELSTDESPKFVNGLLARIVEVKPTLV